MPLRSLIVATVFTLVSVPASAAEADGRARADAITWPVATGRDTAVVVDIADRPAPSAHADAITWDCPKTRHLTH